VTPRERERRRLWRLANRKRLREYLKAYRRANHATLELKRKCRLAGVNTAPAQEAAPSQGSRLRRSL
jgi:hypothetical protein